MSRCVSETMRKALLTITPETGVASAARLALRHRQDYLLVLDGGTLAGIVCRTDLDRPNSSGLVRDCMSSPVYCVGPNTTFEEAATIMDQNEIGCLPVVEDSRLLGLITDREVRAVTAPPRVDDAAAIRPNQPVLCAICRQRRAVLRSLVASRVPVCGVCHEDPRFSTPPKGN